MSAATLGPADCPHQVTRPVMLQGWEALTFLHWRFEPDAVQRPLPGNLRVETCDGSAWVGLVPFVMTVMAAGAPPAPWLSRFCETNVRTYVRDAAGRSGGWFFSLFSRARSRRRDRFARAWHAPWQLYRASAVAVAGELVDEPVVRYSPGVAVRIGLSERAGTA